MDRGAEFIYCPYCERYAWVQGIDRECLDCGRQTRLCEDCKIELVSHEHGLCSLCASSKEHIRGLGWE